MKTIYLAGPYGFSEITNYGIKLIEQKLSTYFKIINPFTSSPDLSKEIIEIETNFVDPNHSIPYFDAYTRLHEINMQLGQNNSEAIQSADIVFAILDGADVDSGTAAEIGYAYGIGKQIWGYRGDFRYSRDNLGAKVNLQVQFFIEASGGQIISSIEQLELMMETNQIN